MKDSEIKDIVFNTLLKRWLYMNECDIYESLISLGFKGIELSSLAEYIITLKKEYEEQRRYK